jgi:thiol-disulfide isomerase/thioredoxin
MTVKSSLTQFFTNKVKVAVLAIVILACLCIIAYYFIVMQNNKSGFTSGSNDSPNLKPSANECVVALFYADWCPHCVTFKPIFQQAKAKMENKPCKSSTLQGKTLRFEKVDSEAYPALSKEYGVNGFPTVKLITTSGTTDYSSGRDLDSMNNFFFPN